ncbi:MULTISPECIES: homocitrate synthase [Dehalococcoides]|uniref:Citrate (Re)-synthase n=3 Tax=Dehalococcoides mccartyi TaxID=61435 RepID=CIRSY_DEHMC|nr:MULTISPECIES: homocitrate synthase [Dehalococcoides]P0DO96.1 RecName: Full=Citrate (Re)-synthase; AltName: Full=Re face-specific citrate synthase; AltName: Full=Re-citrate synthase [Dehalococcoides mccartyi CBDB1]AGG07087.1 re-citrate synthase [Dehalococcoides mccartyi DCMB5]AQU06542.1 homocitrate synthase [Dehalococcoides mccartyi]AQU07982.1 homocitrate synthase [Dehalococcoides mccartyi]AQW63004.1 homocitrate synthase [Dehalococcoides mccartyi]AQX73909.1 homocitrate synthase [Dehalococco
MGKIFIIDVTNRDGVQTARLGLSKLEKTLINIYLDEMGIFQSEFGFPTTKHERGYVEANLELAKMGVIKNLRLEGWIRAIVADVDLAFRRAPSLKHLNLSISTSEQMINGKFQGRKVFKDIIEDMTIAVNAAYAKGAETVGVNAEDASRTSIVNLIEFGKAAKEVGATRLRYCDTLGYDNPFTIYETARTLAEKVGMPIEIHCHGDLGMAIGNSLAGAKGVIDGGQDVYVNTTVNGIGERAGNADLVAFLLAILKSKGFGEKYQLGHEVDLSKAWKIARFASYAFDVEIPINQPGVGRNCFAHASGIHADGVIKDSQNYELYGYEELGRGEALMVETGREICAGQYSGISGFRHVMGNMSVELPEDKDEANKILELVRYANVEAHKPLVEDELIFIAKYPEISRRLLTLTPLMND